MVYIRYARRREKTGENEVWKSERPTHNFSNEQRIRQLAGVFASAFPLFYFYLLSFLLSATVSTDIRANCAFTFLIRFFFVSLIYKYLLLLLLSIFNQRLILIKNNCPDDSFRRSRRKLNFINITLFYQFNVIFFLRNNLHTREKFPDIFCEKI